jgi:hypothetical protein
MSEDSRVFVLYWESTRTTQILAVTVAATVKAARATVDSRERGLDWRPGDAESGTVLRADCPQYPGTIYRIVDHCLHTYEGS